MKRTAFLLVAATAILPGCGRFWEDPYVTVTATPLNWIEIHYYNARHDPPRRVSVRINGVGHVETMNGTSKLVSDSFAKTFTDPTWGDVRRHEYNVDPEHVREVFQSLVNAGLFDKEKFFKSTPEPSKGRFIAVRAAMDNKTFSEPENIFEADPELAEMLHGVVLEFNRPTLKAAKSPAKKPETKEKP